MKWCLAAVGHVYDCNEAAIVYYDTASGDTHLLSAFAAHLIQIISSEPLTIEGVIDKVAFDTEGDDRATLGEAVASTLQQLADLDIVENI